MSASRAAFLAPLALLLTCATAARADGYGFRTPSGNIYCNGSTEVSEITCAIVDRSGTPAAPDTGECPDVWGHRITLDRTGPARIVCGPPPRKSSYTDVAPYGVTGRFADITCLSEETGLQCTNRTGNGFFLSRRAQQIW